MKCQKLQGKKGQLLKVYEHPIYPFVKFAGTYKQVFETKWYTPQKRESQSQGIKQTQNLNLPFLIFYSYPRLGGQAPFPSLLALQANLYKIDIKNWLCGGVVNSLNSDKQHIFVILQ